MNELHEQTVLKKWDVQPGWLSSPGYDLILILGILLIALISGGLVLLQPHLLVPILLIDVWLLGYHHVIATFTKLAGTPEDRRENKFLIYYLPFIVLGAVVILATTLGIWSVVTIYFFWQWYHYTRQAHGISSFYRRKSPQAVSENPYLSQAALWSIPVWGIMNRCHQGWDEFLLLPVWLLHIPDWLLVITALSTIFLCGWWLLNRFISWYNGILPLGQTLFMLSHFVAFYVGYIWIDNINIGWFVVNIWHNAQYILFVWLYNVNRFKKEPHPQTKWLSWAAQPQPLRILAYFSGSLFLTALFYGSLQSTFLLMFGHNKETLTMLYVVAFQAINFHHYVVDSMIWKARKKQHQQVMNLNAGSN